MLTEGSPLCTTVTKARAAALQSGSTVEEEEKEEEEGAFSTLAAVGAPYDGVPLGQRCTGMCLTAMHSDDDGKNWERMGKKVRTVV